MRSPTPLLAAAALALLGLASLGAALPGAGPGNIVVLAEGYHVEEVTTGYPFATSIAFRDGKLLIADAGRYGYESPWNGHRLGKLTELTLSDEGAVLAARTVVTGLADTTAVAVAPNRDVYISQYGEVSVIRAASFDSASPVVESWSTGHPSATSDVGYLPVTGAYVPAPLGETGALEVDTTGPMGITFRASDGQAFVAQSARGRPPDDYPLRVVTGLDYDNPYSSAVLAPAGGPLTPDAVAARACRNCYDLAFAPPGNPHAGELFISENVGPYRARLEAGSGRSVLEGASATDWNLFDGVNHVDLETGTIRRVASFRPDSAILGITPTGMAFATPEVVGFENEMFVALFSGFVPQSDDRGQIVVVRPDMLAGAATGVPFATGLDFPTDLDFSPSGDVYVIEYFTGTVYRFYR